MKILKIIAGIIGCGILAIFLPTVILHIFITIQHSELTESQIVTMFDKAGGVDKVNQEAKNIFNQFGTGEVKFLTQSNLNGFPAISSLGNSVILYPESIDAGKFPPHMEIRFGSHFNTKFVFIFETKNVAQFQNDLKNFQVASNIFVSK